MLPVLFSLWVYHHHNHNNNYENNDDHIQQLLQQQQQQQRQRRRRPLRRRRQRNELSPTAEAVFKQVTSKAGRADKFDIESCGTGGGSPNW